MNPSWAKARSQAFTNAKSSLLLAFWLSDDIYNRTKDMDIPWSFPYPSVESQPIRLALAFLLGVDARPMNSLVDFNSKNPMMGSILFSNLTSDSNFRCYSDLVEAIPSFSNPYWDKFISNMSCSTMNLVNHAPTVSSFLTIIEFFERFNDTEIEEKYSELVPFYKAFLENRSPSKQLHNFKISQKNLELIALQSISSSQSIESISYSPEFLGSRKALKSSICSAASSLYFPITQYVSSHYGISNSGVNIPEEVLLENGQFSGQEGTEDNLHIYYESEAAAGNADAAVYMGKRFFWGLGGVEPDEVEARR